LRLLPERWTIDFWPMRTIVSLYLVVTGGLIGVAIVVFGLSPAHTSPARDLAGAGAVGAFFLVATALMWTRMRGNWIAAAAAAFIGGGAWWLAAYAILAQPRRASVGSTLVFAVMTAVVTLGVLFATLQRAPGEA
jgi:hypothetical protein